MSGTSVPGWRLAIDFGTTNTAAATEHRGQVSALRLDGEEVMRSAVLVTDGTVKCGNAAARNAALYPAHYEPTPKRRLQEGKIVLGGTWHSVVDLVAAVLAKVYTVALADADQAEPDQVVLTHPQAWQTHRVGQLRTAATRAGIPADRLHFVPEPVATAWHYATVDPLPSGAYLAVLDLGGGTCDVALLRHTLQDGNRHFEVLNSAGIDPLGGHDFDDRLETWVRTQLVTDKGQDFLDHLDGEHQARERLLLRDNVRTAKESLSEHQTETIGIQLGTEPWIGTITRDDYEHLVTDDIARVVTLVRTVLDRALPPGGQLDRLYLTGGSSVTPLLQQQLEEHFPGRLGRRAERKQVTASGALHTPRTTTPPPPPPPDQPPHHVEPSRPHHDQPPPRDPRQEPAPVPQQDSPVPDHLPQPSATTGHRNWTRVGVVSGGVLALAAATTIAVMAAQGRDGGSTPDQPRETTTEAPASGPVIATAADMEQLIVDNELALRSSCRDASDEMDTTPGAVIYFDCSDTLTDFDATLQIVSFNSLAETQAFFDGVINQFDVEHYEPWTLGQYIPDGEATGQSSVEDDVTGVVWTDESTMTVSVLQAQLSDLESTGDDWATVYVHWLLINDYHY